MSKHVSGIKVVLFDHDDTLVGTIGPKWAQHKHVARECYGKELTDEELRQHWGKPLGELMCLLYDTDDVESAFANNAAYRHLYPKALYEATVPTLRRLKAAGIMVGIVTATIRDSLNHDLSTLAIPDDLFDYMQTAEDTSFHKPDPRVFEPALHWMDEQSIQPSEALYIGDGLHDAGAALGAGLSFLGVETGLVTAEAFNNVGILSIPHIGHLIEEH